MSWPTGHGRRAWISMGPFGWTLWVLFVLPVYAVLLAVFAVVWVIRALWIIADETVKWARARKPAERPSR
jgi:uncharacterized protein HemY